MDPAAPSARVIEAVAQKEGVPPTELLPPLYEVIDPDALDALVHAGIDTDTSRVEIEFSYRDHDIRVQITPTLEVSIRETATSSAASTAAAQD